MRMAHAAITGVCGSCGTVRSRAAGAGGGPRGGQAQARADWAETGERDPEGGARARSGDGNGVYGVAWYSVYRAAYIHDPAVWVYV